MPELDKEVDMASGLMRAMFAEHRPEAPTQLDDPVQRLLALLSHGELSSGDLRKALRIRHRQTFRENYLHLALADGLIEYTIPEKPNSRLKKYRLTEKGQRLLVANKRS